MQIDYRRDICHSYLILSGGEEPDTSSYQVRMLMTNQISGFLPCQIQQIDQKMMFYYDVTSRQPLQMILEHRQIGKEMMELLLAQIAAALEQIKNYLLNLDGLILRPDFIFLDASGGQLWFCYYPGNDLTFQDQIRELSEYLLPKLEHQDRAAVMMGYAFYQKCVEETITTEVFHELLHGGFREWKEQSCGEDQSRKMPEQEPEPEGGGRRGQTPPDREELLDAFFAPEEPADPASVWNGKRAFLFLGMAAAAAVLLGILGAAGRLAEGVMLLGAASGIGLAGFVVKRTVRENREREEEMKKYIHAEWQEENHEAPSSGNSREKEPEETVYLNAVSGDMQGHRGCLVPEENTPGGTVFLDKEVHLIGKDRDAADILLLSPAVSRLHARLVWEGDTYLLSDMNSRNGTAVEGKLLESGEARALMQGERVRFANLTYCFRK